jgi:hypothetical protein
MSLEQLNILETLEELILINGSVVVFGGEERPRRRQHGSPEAGEFEPVEERR